jgi:outer membrane protein OmpA-like peptidoglycan-associated protein
MTRIYRFSVLMMLACAAVLCAQFAVEPWEEEAGTTPPAQGTQIERLARFKARLEATQRACSVSVDRVDIYPLAVNRIEEARILLSMNPPNQFGPGAFEKAWYATRAALLQFKAVQMEAHEVTLEATVQETLKRLDVVRDSVTKLRTVVGMRQPEYDKKKETAAIEEAIERGLNDLNGTALTVTKTSRGTVITVSDLLFDPGKAGIKDDLKISLAKLVQILKINPKAKLSIEGHTDNTGTDAVNHRLSLDRASSVRDFLIAKGMDATRVTAIGLGSSQPVAPNDTERNRQKNRRVEAIIKSE